MSAHKRDWHLFSSYKELQHSNDTNQNQEASVVAGYPQYTALPKTKLQERGFSADSTYRLISDDLYFDVMPRLNMASFVTTYMEPQAEKLMDESLKKNLVDTVQYPSLIECEKRCLSIIYHLWNAPKDAHPYGTATTGSSEGILLGGIAMKRRWKEKRLKQGLDASKPNVVYGSNAHCCIDKFANYHDVEARIVPVSKESNFVMNSQDILEKIDENTIGVYCILGSTYTGTFENILETSKVLDKYQEETGIDIPIHVDAASGGFVAPFSYPDLLWDFRLDRVKSINASGHKYGLVYAGLGWVAWRDKSYFPESLSFTLQYLGSNEESISINFSRSGANVIAQYYNFCRLGKSGYEAIINENLFKARLLSVALATSGIFECVSRCHKPKNSDDQLKLQRLEKFNIPFDLKILQDNEFFEEALPVVAFKFSDSFMADYPDVKQSDLVNKMKEIGWIIPNYSLPPNVTNTQILRTVIREDFSENSLSKFLQDILKSTLALTGNVDAKSEPVLQNANIKTALSLVDFDGAIFAEPRRKSRPFVGTNFSTIC